MFFKYCIWLTSKNHNCWSKYTNGFDIHISIKTKFKYLYQAQQFFKELKDHGPIIVEKKGNMINENTKGFHAAYYNVVYSKKNKESKPEWWPKSAHASFLYKYNFKIFNFEIKELERKIKEKFCIFDKIIIMKCDYHHSFWKEQSIDSLLKKRH